MIDALRDDFLFKVVTPDRDGRDEAPYPGITPDAWNRRGGAEVLYLSPGRLSLRFLAGTIRSTPHDLIYLNSFFSFRFSCFPLLLARLGLVERKPVVLAPRGQFSAGALEIKAPKKRLFISAAKLSGLYRGLLWQASAAGEAADIRRLWGEQARIAVAPNLVRPVPDRENRPQPEKKPGALRIAYFSRITPKKNLDFALRSLRGLPGKVIFDICGPVGDRRYWKRCRETISTLPPNVKVVYHNDIKPEQGLDFLGGRHLFYLPTRGENFGHAVWESLAAGCPVLISDRTPWRNLEEEGAGWDLPLEDPAAFRRILEKMLVMGAKEFTGLSRRARALSRKISSDRSRIEDNRNLFISALQSGRH